MPTLRQRRSGVLLHPTSLPGPAPIGDIGPAAIRFLDFLSSAGQSWWQMLPVNPAGAGDSPYSSDSAFAGNPLLISLEWLVTHGYLKRSEIPVPPKTPHSQVMFDRAWEFKTPLFRRAFERFTRNARLRRGYTSFRRKNSDWLADYVLFRALKEAFPGRSWTQWEKGLRQRRPDALRRARKTYSEEISYNTFVQFIFWRQWEDLRSYARKSGVGLIGDIPIFIAHESADVWVNPSFFFLDAKGLPTIVSGVPPDYFSDDGQLWGNPLYRWSRLRKAGYSWWVRRFKQALGRFDALRLDHFIGFSRQWEVPRGSKTARPGRWGKGPGDHFFTKILSLLGPIEIVAEDLGELTPQIRAMRDGFRFPGIRVLQFAFGDDPAAKSFQPHTFPRRCVVYTGTHDNDTTVGWFMDPGSDKSTRSAASIKREKISALRYMRTDGFRIHWDMIRLALNSRADTAIIPMQDLLGLDGRARMNTPGTPSGNWGWRLSPGSLDKLSRKLRSLTRSSGRWSRSPQ